MYERPFQLPDGAVRIPLYEIRFIEVRSNYVMIHAKQEVTVKMTLSALEKRLDDSFFRVGRSYIVNMRYFPADTFHFLPYSAFCDGAWNIFCVNRPQVIKSRKNFPPTSRICGGFARENSSPYAALACWVWLDTKKPPDALRAGKKTG